MIQPRRNTGKESAPAVGGPSEWLVRRAACTVPPPLGERLEEEWLADLQARPTALSRLRFALGCWWARRAISLEHAGAAMAVASSSSSGQLAAPYRYDESGHFAGRSGTVLVVIAFHIAVFYALVSNIGGISVPWTPPPLVPRFLPPQARHEAPPPQPDKTLKNWQLVPVIPEIVAPADDAREGERIDTSPRIDPPPTGQTPVVKRLQGGPGAGFPDAEDYYPPAAKRLEEQGIATVRVCVDASGRLSAAPAIAQSSGSARLDEGALRLAQAGSGHYLASTEDGRAVDSCYAFRIRFKLRS